MSGTSALGGDDQRLLGLPPAQSRATRQPEQVVLLGGQARDGELAGVGAHLHRGPALGVCALQPVGDLVAWQGEETG